MMPKIAPDAPAEKAGVQQGDVLLSFGGKQLNDVRDLITLAQVQGTRYSYVNIGRVRTCPRSLSCAAWARPSGGSAATARA